MANELWWTWKRRTIALISAEHNMYQLYSGIVRALSKDKGYMDVKIQDNGVDVFGWKNGVCFAVKHAETIAPSYFWEIIACGGGTKSQADMIFNEIRAVVDKIVSGWNAPVKK